MQTEFKPNMDVMFSLMLGSNTAAYKKLTTRDFKWSNGSYCIKNYFA